MANISEDRKNNIVTKLKEQGISPSEDAIAAVAEIMAKKPMPYAEAVAQYKATLSNGHAKQHSSNQAWQASQNAANGAAGVMAQGVRAIAAQSAPAVAKAIVAQTLTNAMDLINSGDLDLGEIFNQIGSGWTQGLESAEEEVKYGGTIDPKYQIGSSSDMRTFAALPEAKEIANSNESKN